MKNLAKIAMIQKKFYSIIFLFLFFSFYSSQVLAVDKGKIAGKLVDSETGEALIGANVYLENTALGAATDLDGNYVILQVPVGNYVLVVSTIGYAETKITDVAVEAEKVTKLNLAIHSEIITSETITVEAKALKNTEASLLKDRQKSIAVSDAVSAEAISRAGSGNAADAMKQVTGASVVDGKYVYVRGLGDRYTSIHLNGAELPSVDPYKRAGAIDLIPSNLIDNIVAVKSFTPDKPGDFSGGTVDVHTKDFPDKLNLSFSTSATYNSQSTFNEDALTYKGGNRDWLGYDDGIRAIPQEVGNDLYLVDFGAAQQDMNKAMAVDQITKSFNQNMVPHEYNPPVNQSYAFSLGDQINLFNRPLGYLGSITYSRSTSHFDDGEYNAWWLGQSEETQEVLENVYTLKNVETKNEVLWGSQLKLSYKIDPQHILSLDGIYNQNGESTAQFLNGPYPYDLPEERMYQVNKLQYKESSLINFQLNGQHNFESLLNSRIHWKGSYANVSQDEPDLRFFYNNYSLSDSVYRMKSNLAPERYYRFLDEDQWEGKIDLEFPFQQWSGLNSKLKIGALYAKKSRGFQERRFTYQNYLSRRIKSLNDVGGDINKFFSYDNMGMIGSRETPDGRIFPILGIYISEEKRETSNYTGEQNISAGYAMLDMPLMQKLRFIGGARYEETDMQIISANEALQPGIINNKDILPSVNLIYNLVENINVRAAYTKTLARPTFREIARFESYDFNGGNKYVGNPNLKRTLIDNLDLRWEWFSRPGEIYAVSAFYKDFHNPIELTIKGDESSDATNIAFTWKNVTSAKVMGVEFEIRKNLDIIAPVLKDFKFGSNISFIHSTVDIDTSEFEDIQDKRLDPSDTRPFQGQSPYLLNLSLSYDNVQNGISASIYYNIFGERLAIVSLSGTPDVYEQPYGLLNVSFSMPVWKNIDLKLKANNLLDSEEKKSQEFKGREYIYRLFNRGRSFSIGISYKFTS